jgi:hypothetical protein
MESAILEAIAGVTRNVECTRQKLYHAKCEDKAAFMFSSFFEKAFVNRVKRRSCIRIAHECERRITRKWS